LCLIEIMKVRILTNTNTRVNENWNSYGDINSSVQESYVAKEIATQSNKQHKTNSLQEDFYIDIGIDIVTETVFNYPNPQITEKTFRSIANKKMFIVVGPPRSLQYLKSVGFETFDNFINEDYDVIQNPIQRMNFLCNEIKRICELDIKEINNAIKNNDDVLNHNFEQLINLQSHDLKKLDHIFNRILS